MTPFPHPYGDSELTINRIPEGGVVLNETTWFTIPADKLAALVAIVAMGSVRYSGASDEEDQLDRGSKTIPLSVAEWLVERGMLEDDPMDWGIQWYPNARAKRVVELAQEGRT